MDSSRHCLRWLLIPTHALRDEIEASFCQRASIFSYFLLSTIKANQPRRYRIIYYLFSMFLSHNFYTLPVLGREDLKTVDFKWQGANRSSNYELAYSNKTKQSNSSKKSFQSQNFAKNMPTRLCIASATSLCALFQKVLLMDFKAKKVLNSEKLLQAAQYLLH